MRAEERDGGATGGPDGSRHLDSATTKGFTISGAFLTSVWQRPAGLFATATVLSLAVYWATLAPGLSWAHSGTDGGELIAAAVTLGVPHPPGYPTYVFLGKMFSLLPVGTIAYRFNLLSAVCSAVAAGFVALTVRDSASVSEQGPVARPNQEGRTLGEQAAGQHVAALAAALFFALLPLVWRQALISEVYAVNLMFVAALVWTLFSRAPETRPWLPGLLLGLAGTTHLTSLLLIPAVLGLTPFRRWPGLLLGFSLGMAPYLAIPLLASGDSPVVWGRPTTVQGWWWLVSARIYRPNLFSLDPEQWSTRLVAWFREPSVPIGIVMSLVVLARRRAISRVPQRAPLLLLATAGLYAIYAFFYDAPDSLVLLLPALLVLCVLFGRLEASAGPIVMILPLLLLVLNFQRVDLSDADVGGALAEEVLAQAPARAILFTAGDEATFTLWYYLYAENRRNDLVVVDENLFAFDWYREDLRRRYPDLRHMERDDLAGFRRRNAGGRAQCTVRLQLESMDARVTCGDEGY